MYQPSADYPNAGASTFTRTQFWAQGILPYINVVRFWLYGEGSAIGKMTFNLKIYENDVMKKKVIPWDVRSHDFWEAMWTPTGFLIGTPAEKIKVFENTSTSFFVMIERSGRWIPGDVIALKYEHAPTRALLELSQGKPGTAWKTLVSGIWRDITGRSHITPEGAGHIKGIMSGMIAEPIFAVWLIGLGLMALQMPGLITATASSISNWIFGTIMVILIGQKFAMPLFREVFEGGIRDFTSRLKLEMIFLSAGLSYLGIIIVLPLLATLSPMTSLAIMATASLIFAAKPIINKIKGMSVKEAITATAKIVVAAGALYLFNLAIPSIELSLRSVPAASWLLWVGQNLGSSILPCIIIPLAVFTAIGSVLADTLIKSKFQKVQKIGDILTIDYEAVQIARRAVLETIYLTTILMMNLIYRPIEVLRGIKIVKTGTEFIWKNLTMVEASFAKGIRLIDAYKQFWIAPLFGSLFLLTTILYVAGGNVFPLLRMIDPALAFKGFPIFIISWIFGPYLAWRTAMYGGTQDYVPLPLIQMTEELRRWKTERNTPADDEVIGKIIDLVKGDEDVARDRDAARLYLYYLTDLNPTDEILRLLRAMRLKGVRLEDEQIRSWTDVEWKSLWDQIPDIRRVEVLNKLSSTETGKKLLLDKIGQSRWDRIKIVSMIAKRIGPRKPGEKFWPVELTEEEKRDFVLEEIGVESDLKDAINSMDESDKETKAAIDGLKIYTTINIDWLNPTEDELLRVGRLSEDQRKNAAIWQRLDKITDSNNLSPEEKEWMGTLSNGQRKIGEIWFKFRNLPNARAKLLNWLTFKDLLDLKTYAEIDSAIAKFKDTYNLTYEETKDGKKTVKKIIDKPQGLETLNLLLSKLPNSKNIEELEVKKLRALLVSLQKIAFSEQHESSGQIKERSLLINYGFGVGADFADWFSMKQEFSGYFKGVLKQLSNGYGAAAVESALEKVPKTSANKDLIQALNELLTIVKTYERDRDRIIKKYLSGATDYDAEFFKNYVKPLIGRRIKLSERWWQSYYDKEKQEFIDKNPSVNADKIREESIAIIGRILSRCKLEPYERILVYLTAVEKDLSVEQPDKIRNAMKELSDIIKSPHYDDKSYNVKLAEVKALVSKHELSEDGRKFIWAIYENALVLDADRGSILYLKLKEATTYDEFMGLRDIVLGKARKVLEVNREELEELKKTSDIEMIKKKEQEIFKFEDLVSEAMNITSFATGQKPIFDLIATFYSFNSIGKVKLTQLDNTPVLYKAVNDLIELQQPGFMQDVSLVDRLVKEGVIEAATTFKNMMWSDKLAVFRHLVGHYKLDTAGTASLRDAFGIVSNDLEKAIFELDLQILERKQKDPDFNKEELVKEIAAKSKLTKD
ncbi:MAG: hypothetical protein KKE81_05285, partial [Candidatus Omnitrophica bacterium]|nr:hypothetical protein [Candidatus Omnitrophota bacterium]